MKPGALENTAKFCYDCGKVTFTILVVGVLAQKPFVLLDLVGGTIFTLILLIGGIIINQFEEGDLK